MAKGRRDADRRAGRGRPPSERPGKTCPVCGRPFAWRRRWADSWGDVVYCSERCRRRRRGGPPSDGEDDPGRSS